MSAARQSKMALFVSIISLGFLAVVFTGASPAQQASPSASFAPLDSWKAAVIAGDATTLASLYSTMPPAQAKTPQGDSSSPAEEPSFWSSLAGMKLTGFNPKILEITHPRADMTSLVLRVELDLGGAGAAKPFVVSLAQVWINEAGTWKIYMTQRSDPAPRAAERLPEPAKPKTDLYPPPESAPEEIQTALSAASVDHKRVILVFGGNWCYDCHVLDAAFHSAKIKPIVDANYHVAHINIGDEDKNLDLAKKYEVGIAKGVPSLAVLNPDGSLVFSQKNGEFESSLKLTPDDVVAFLEKWKPALPTKRST